MNTHSILSISDQRDRCKSALDCHPSSAIRPVADERHFEVRRGKFVQLAAGPLDNRLNGENFPMLPEDCGFGGRLFPLRGDEYFEVSVAVTESELGQKYRVVVCCESGPSLSIWDPRLSFWICSAPYEQVLKDASFVLREHIGACYLSSYEALLFISKALRPVTEDRNICAFLEQ